MLNFNSGPAHLPSTVTEQAIEAIRNYKQTGLSILEIAHRSRLFMDIMEEAQFLVKKLLALNNNQEVLFLHGGGSTQFMQIPYNLLPINGTAAYADTGVWSSKAITEAKLFGKVNIACTSKEQNYSFIPTEYAVPTDAAYFYLTTNNTIYGTQWHSIPNIGTPLVADMSSDILSRQLNFSRFSLIFACIQKNLGAAGATLVIIDKTLLGKTGRKIPTILDYRQYIQAGSILNTPPVFAIYTALLMLRWHNEQGGISYFEEQNVQKAKLLYEEVDRNRLFQTHVSVRDRSNMNVCFFGIDDAVTQAFEKYCIANQIFGIQGHRTVGGFRASIYNAITLADVQQLVEHMQYFEKKY